MASLKLLLPRLIPCAAVLVAACGKERVSSTPLVESTHGQVGSHQHQRDLRVCCQKNTVLRAPVRLENGFTPDPLPLIGWTQPGPTQCPAGPPSPAAKLSRGEFKGSLRIHAFDAFATLQLWLDDARPGCFELWYQPSLEATGRPARRVFSRQMRGAAAGRSGGPHGSVETEWQPGLYAIRVLSNAPRGSFFVLVSEL